jgi:hypothetical protein
MKTIKYTYFVLFSLVLIFLNSCSLEEVIKDRPTPATISTEADVTAIIQGMYSRFNDAGMFKFQAHIMLAIMADDLFTTAGSEYASYGDRSLTSANTAPMWNGMYASIASANNLMDVLDKMEFDEAFEKRALGEAYFVRAFAYYYLVRLYGGVPLRTTATRVDSDFYLPRTSVDETYALIFADFKAASERLPLKTAIEGPELGRASKGAAQALLAQAYLTYGNQLALKSQDPGTNYQQAVVYADSVISSNQYSLLVNYGDLFEVTKEPEAYNEVIFGIRFQTDPTNRAQPAAGSEFAPKFGAPNTWGVTANGGRGDGVYLVSHWFADYYRRGDYSNKDALGVDSIYTPGIDYRNEKAFFQRGYNSSNNRYFAVYPNVPGSTIPGAAGDGTINNPLVAKYQDPGGKDARNHGNDFFIIRYAELLLIKAEALNELNGPTTAAINEFNKVRTRARTVNGVPNARLVPRNLNLAVTPLTKDEFRMKIFDERGLELVGEGQRWFDLVRMRSPLSATMTMYEYQFKYVLNDITKYPQTLPGYSTQLLEYTTRNAVYKPILNVTVPKFLLFPVPATELIQNSKFGAQNPGW